MRTALIFLACACGLAAQVGQYPGQYPPGRQPGGVPTPGRGSKRTTETKEAAPQARTYSGTIRTLEEKSFELESKDSRTLIIQITDKTVRPKDLRQGDSVDVEAIQDKDGQFQAINIKFNHESSDNAGASASDAAEPESRAGPPTNIALTSPKYDDGDAGPPKLKRGVPAEYGPGNKRKEQASTEVAALPASTEPAVAPHENPRLQFLAKAREVARVYDEGLPNFICNEVVTRYVSETKVTSWAVRDVLSAELVYEERKENYRNISINGKATKKPPEESGAWSTGEFGTMLVDLFGSTTPADFKYAQDETMAHLPSSVYDFRVARAQSHWKVKVSGQYIFPAYAGSLWIDKQNAHVLRIETQAKEIPEEFPLVKVESAVDYDYVTLGTPEKFLLPVRAEILSCERASNACERNVIEFRNYHKFSGSSTIKFNQ